MKEREKKGCVCSQHRLERWTNFRPDIFLYITDTLHADWGREEDYSPFFTLQSVFHSCSISCHTFSLSWSFPAHFCLMTFSWISLSLSLSLFICVYFWCLMCMSPSLSMSVGRSLSVDRVVTAFLLICAHTHCGIILIFPPLLSLVRFLFRESEGKPFFVFSCSAVSPSFFPLFDDFEKEKQHNRYINWRKKIVPIWERVSITLSESLFFKIEREKRREQNLLLKMTDARCSSTPDTQEYYSCITWVVVDVIVVWMWDKWKGIKRERERWVSQKWWRQLVSFLFWGFYCCCYLDLMP